MKYLLAFSVAVILGGCSPRINKHFEQNKYIRNYNMHIINDSLQMYFYSPADITYPRTKKELRQGIREAGFKPEGDVVVYGKTDQPPYEYFVTISGPKQVEYPRSILVLDTLIDGKTIRFLGNSLTDQASGSLTADLQTAFNSLEYGSEYRQEIVTVLDIVERYRYSNKFYAALEEISQFPSYDGKEAGTQLQMQLTFASFLGKNDIYTSLLKRLETGYGSDKEVSRVLATHIQTGESVLNTILTEAKDHQMVMFNENHIYPNHRFLVSILLPELKKIGFTHLALEALGPDQDLALNQAGAYPNMETGFYASEQNFGNLIRQAKALGFQFVAYENYEADKNRELGQADNLYNKTFGKDPSARVVVLAGIDHILEEPTIDGIEWMASIFKNAYRIDPLTISQTHLNAYRKEIDSDYGLLHSRHFKTKPLTSVDYLVLNNGSWESYDNRASLSYLNESSETLQLMLFYGNEMKDESDYRERIPYYSTLISPGKTYELPVVKDQTTYLITLDKIGKRRDIRKIAPGEPQN